MKKNVILLKYIYKPKVLFNILKYQIRSICDKLESKQGNKQIKFLNIRLVVSVMK